MSSLCKYIHLFLSVLYMLLLSGLKSRKYNETDPIHIDSCSGFYLDATKLTFEQMIYFFSSGPDSYIRNCDCQTIINPRHERGRFDPSKGCKLPREFGADNTCYYYRTGLCKREYGVCS